MIVWGGCISGACDQVLSSGGKYNPGTDSWTATSTNNAPAARTYHAAVWTGSEMIVWGGGDSFSFLNTGGRYNPSTDSWTATNTIDAPAARQFPTNGQAAVWTDSEMIVWGGWDGSTALNTGGRYNPSTDSWNATSTTGAPAARQIQSTVWDDSDSEMIVWGGDSCSLGCYLNTGGRYDPGTDTWLATSTVNAPIARRAARAVWTGREMIVWGGYDGSYVEHRRQI